MDKGVNPIYRYTCPSCGGDAEAFFLEKFGVCSRCASKGDDDSILNAYNLHYTNKLEIEHFSEFFTRATDGLKLWGAQKTWASRLISGENTVIIAPTGMGKTTLLLIYTLYLFKYIGKKSLILAPTRTLAKQMYERLKGYRDKLGLATSILFYDSGKSRKKRLEVLDRVRKGDFDILVVTNHFLARYYTVLPQEYIDFIVIDDVDSLLRSSKNIKRLLKLLGYPDELIELVRRRNSLLWRIMVSKSLNNEELYRSLVQELIELEGEIERMLLRGRYKQVVIASATGRIKGSYGKVLRELLRIDVSGITIYGRDVTDTFMLIDNWEDATKIVELITGLGRGGILYLSPRHPDKRRFEKVLKTVSQMLSGKGFRIGVSTPGNVKKLINGELDLLIGSSSYYGSSVRGIDAPGTVRYVIFLGTPLFTINLESFLTSPKSLIRALLLLREELGDDEWGKLVSEARRLFLTMSSGEQRIVSMYLKGRLSRDDLSEKIKGVIEKTEQIYQEVLNGMRYLLDVRGVVELSTITMAKHGEKYVVLVPDTMTYIQASGRVSRLRLGGMTHGLSVIVETSGLSNNISALERKISVFSRDFKIRNIEEVDLKDETRRIDESRRAVYKKGMKYRNVLVIVESPTKARTIAGFFGKPVRRKIYTHSVYEIPFRQNDEIIHLNIAATKGHIYDLTTDPNAGHYGVVLGDHEVKPIYTTIKRCRVCGYQFTHGDKCPRCGSSSFTDSKTIVDLLRKLAQEADEVFIATDPDIEGEKIAYDVYLSIKAFTRNVWRIELHEITLEEFLKALERRRRIDSRLVEAEIYRRVLDRLVGFSLSHTVQDEYGKRWLGAGRVQTPVLGWIIDRYKEYSKNRCYRLRIATENKLVISKCFTNKEEAKSIREKDKVLLVIKDRYVKEFNPRPPLTTDELLYTTGRLGIPSRIIMKTAQELFESGLITYHRTSYHYISSNGISVASRYLANKGLNQYFKPSHWGEKGAHEAIRPVYPYDRVDLEKAVAEGLINPPIPLSWLHYRVYDIIFRRFMESQLRPYKGLVIRARAYIGDLDLGELEFLGGIIEHGADLASKPRIVEIDPHTNKVWLNIESVSIRRSSTVGLYDESEIIRRMKEEGLGRPSTFATIISSIYRHGYAIRSKKRGYLIPTKLGINVYEALSTRYPLLISIDTTRHMEENINKIASGVIDAYSAISEVVDQIRMYELPLGYTEAGIGRIPSISS